MPSVTVVVSSDTDIYISPGLYGDCLPTSATGESEISFRAGRVLVLLSTLVLFMLAHAARSGSSPRGDGRRRRFRFPGPSGAPGRDHVTSTLWASSN
ncbi:hypothetical protein EF917_22075 [Streptomyces sp. WAC00469]|nr:hypothetical protein EF917_22075 [Streptomyces sp. WAC00469]